MIQQRCKRSISKSREKKLDRLHIHRFIEARVALETYALGCLCSVILCMATPLSTFHQSWRKFCRRLMRSKRFHWVNVVVLILYMKTSIINRQLQLSNPILFIHASQMFLQIYRPPRKWTNALLKKGTFFFFNRDISSSKNHRFSANISLVPRRVYLHENQAANLWCKGQQRHTLCGTRRSAVPPWSSFFHHWFS